MRRWRNDEASISHLLRAGKFYEQGIEGLKLSYQGRKGDLLAEK